MGRMIPGVKKLWAADISRQTVGGNRTKDPTLTESRGLTNDNSILKEAAPGKPRSPVKIATTSINNYGGSG